LFAPIVALATGWKALDWETGPPPVGNLILVVEIKGDEELHEPSEENRKKNEYAIAHFQRVNRHLEEEENPIRYKFNFLTKRSFNKFFQSLRDGNIEKFRSELDVKLTEGTWRYFV